MVCLDKADPERGRMIPKESRTCPAEEYVKQHSPVAVLDAVQRELHILDNLNEALLGLRRTSLVSRYHRSSTRRVSTKYITSSTVR